MKYTDLCARLKASTGLNAWTREPVQDHLRLEADAAIRELEAERDRRIDPATVDAMISAAQPIMAQALAVEEEARKAAEAKVAELVEALRKAHEALLWCARDGRMASPSLHQYPAKWAAEAAAALTALSEQNTALAAHRDRLLSDFDRGVRDMFEQQTRTAELAAQVAKLTRERDQIAQLAATLQNEAERLHEELSAAEAKVAELTRLTNGQAEIIEKQANTIIRINGQNETAEAKLATCEKYRDAYAECDRIGTQAVRDLEAKVARLEGALRKIGTLAPVEKPPEPYDENGWQIADTGERHAERVLAKDMWLVADFARAALTEGTPE